MLRKKITFMSVVNSYSRLHIISVAILIIIFLLGLLIVKSDWPYSSWIPATMVGIGGIFTPIVFFLGVNDAYNKAYHDSFVKEQDTKN